MSGANLGPLFGEESEDTGLGHRGPESKSIVVPYGFWLFILSDIVNDLWDVQLLFEHLRKLCTPKTRVRTATMRPASRRNRWSSISITY